MIVYILHVGYSILSYAFLEDFVFKIQSGEGLVLNGSVAPPALRKNSNRLLA
jgi:hypothetical protein